MPSINKKNTSSVRDLQVEIIPAPTGPSDRITRYSYTSAESRASGACYRWRLVRKLISQESLIDRINRQAELFGFNEATGEWEGDRAPARAALIELRRVGSLLPAICVSNEIDMCDLCEIEPAVGYAQNNYDAVCLGCREEELASLPVPLQEGF